MPPIKEDSGSTKKEDEKAVSAPQKEKKADKEVKEEKKEDTPSKEVKPIDKKRRLSLSLSKPKEEPKEEKPKEDKSNKKVRYEDIMDPDDPLTMIKELLLQQAAEVIGDEELQARPSSRPSFPSWS